MIGYIIFTLISILLCWICIFLTKNEQRYFKHLLKIKHVILLYLICFIPGLSLLIYFCLFIVLIFDSDLRYDFQKYHILNKIFIFLNKEYGNS